jgi:hypothetical protein
LTFLFVLLVDQLLFEGSHLNLLLRKHFLHSFRNFSLANLHVLDLLRLLHLLNIASHSVSLCIFLLLNQSVENVAGVEQLRAGLVNLAKGSFQLFSVD